MLAFVVFDIVLSDIWPGNGVRLFWQNGKGCKSKKIDEASTKGKSKRY